jgi:thioredoxin-like negative regulator of GroEL
MSQSRRLSNLVLFSVSLLVGTAMPLTAGEIPWRLDYTAARKEAQEKNKPIVLDFGTANCHWCKQLDTTTFRDPAIVKALTERFIPVKIDAGKDPELAQALGITSFPTLIFAAPNGKIVGQQDGYIEAANFGRELNRLFGGDDRQSSTASETNVQAPNIKNEPERLAQVCEKLTDALGNAYLELAEGLVRKGQTQQALGYLEKAVRTCPGTQAAQLAQERILQLRDSKGVVRTQMP